MSMRRAEIVTGRIIDTDTLAVIRNSRIPLHDDEVVNPLVLIQRRSTHVTHSGRYQIKSTNRINVLNG